MRAIVKETKNKMKKKTKIALAITIAVLALLVIGSEIYRQVRLKQIELTRQEAAYAKRLRVLGAQEDISLLADDKYYIEVEVKGKTYYYNNTTAYINWYGYCYETGNETITYETFVQAMLNPEETPENKAIMKWVDEMNGTANTQQIRETFMGYLAEPSVLGHPEQNWPKDVDACTLEQLKILYDYHVVQRGW